MMKILLKVTGIGLLASLLAAQASALQVNSQLQKAYLERLSSAPSDTVEGRIYYNTTTDIAQYYANGAWRNLDEPRTTVAVLSGGTGLTSGTSGGFLYFSGAGTIASSSAYTAGRVLVGGGAGNAPTSSANLTYSSSILNVTAAGAVAPGTNGITITDSTGSSSNFAGIGFASSGNAGSSRIVSFVDGGGATGGMAFMSGGSTPTETMRVSGAQELWIGYTSDNGAYKLQVNSQIFATNATVATSDARFKENVQDVTGALALVDKLKPKSFTWKKDVGKVEETDASTGKKTLLREPHNFVDGRSLGFIAQDVQTAFADQPWVGNLVKSNGRKAPKGKDGSKKGEDEEFLGLAYTDLIPLLAGAIKELKAKNEALEARVTALEAK